MSEMRRLISLVESREPVAEETLYRGDASAVSAFDFERADNRALFGRGIYLTDNERVAADYTVKASEHVICRADEREDEEPAQTPEAIVAMYLRRLMQAAGWQEAFGSMRADLQASVRRGEIERSAGEKLLAQRTDEITQKFLKQARATYKAKQKDLRIVQATTGEYMIVKADREGYVTSFEVPEGYLSKFLPGDGVLPDRALAVIREMLIQGQPDRKLDMRDARSNFCTFDQWCDAYRTIGIDYAWEHEVVRGKGNPSLDAIRNGTHYGFQRFYDDAFEREFIKRMQALGYIGIEYDGGKRLGSHVRGGGGVRHRAYVVWDANDLEKFRKDSIRVNDPALATGIASRIRSTNKLYRIS